MSALISSTTAIVTYALMACCKIILYHKVNSLIVAVAHSSKEG